MSKDKKAAFYAAVYLGLAAATISTVASIGDAPVKDQKQPTATQKR